MTDSRLILRRALAYWRGRYTPTFIGILRLSAALHRKRAFTYDDVVAAAWQFPHRGAPSLWGYPLYKKTTADGHRDYRQCTACAPTLAIAESLVLEELSRQPAFANSSDVYSYRWPGRRAGRPYAYFVDGYEERSRDVTAAVRDAGDVEVVVADLKSFYSSVRTEDVRRQLAQARGISASALRVIRGFLPGEDEGLPIGPALSHTLANLVLRSVDEELRHRFPGRYFRYVDDIVVVTRRGEGERAREHVASSVGRLGLTLNLEKGGSVTAAEWLASAPRLREEPMPRGLSFGGLLDVCAWYLREGGGGAGERLAELTSKAEISLPLEYLAARAEGPGLGWTIGRSSRSKPAWIWRVEVALGRHRRFLEFLLSSAVQLRDRCFGLLRRFAAQRAANPVVLGWQAQATRRLLARACYLSRPARYAEILELVPADPAYDAQRALVRALKDQRPGYLLPFPGGVIATAGLLWRAHDNPPSEQPIRVRSPEFLESALDLALRGVVKPSSVVLGETPAHRVARALLSPGRLRGTPDLSYADELESLFLGCSPEEVVRFMAQPSFADDLGDLELS